MKKGYFTIIILILLFLLANFVSGSYAVSSPGKINVERGSSKDFYFQIQGYRSDENLNCKVDLPSIEPFSILFENEEVYVPKGGFSFVRGVLKTNKKVVEGDYSYSFCVSCMPESKGSGATMNLRFCGVPFEIGVVEPAKEMMSPAKITFISLGILLLVCFFIFFLFILLKKK